MTSPATKHDDIDIMADVAKPQNLNEVMKLARWVQEVESDIQTAEDRLAKLVALRHRILSADMPEVMAANHVPDITVNGQRFYVDDIVKAGLPTKDAIEKAKDDEKAMLVKKRDDGFKWLRGHRAGDLIKYKVTIDFDKGKVIDGLLNMLKRWKGIQVKHDETVHPSTLTVFCKEQLAEGKLDAEAIELFSVYSGRHVKIQNVKPKK